MVSAPEEVLRGRLLLQPRRRTGAPGIRVRSKENPKELYFAHTLNNTVVAPPRMLIAFLENNLREDGSVAIPKPLQPYMGGMTELRKK